MKTNLKNHNRILRAVLCFSCCQRWRGSERQSAAMLEARDQRYIWPRASQHIPFISRVNL